MDSHQCPEAIGGHQAGRDGSCRWCGRRNVDLPVQRPTHGGFAQDVYADRTDLELSYSYFYDPDFGTNTWEVY